LIILHWRWGFTPDRDLTLIPRLESPVFGPVWPQASEGEPHL
jgi:hypothetical protein